MLLQDWDPAMYDKSHAWAEKAQGMQPVSDKGNLTDDLRSKLNRGRTTTRLSVV